jgi:lysozyme
MVRTRAWNMMNKAQWIRLPIAALALSASAFVGLKVSEGYSDTAIIPVPGDVPTIGFGTTEGVQMGDRTTPVKAVVRALQDVSKFEGALKQCVSAPLHQHEYDAYISLAYNVGSGAFCGSSIPRKLSAGEYEAACKTILDFNKMKDCTKPKVWNPRTQRMECPLVEIRGLTLRRQKEFNQCMGTPG